MQHLLIVKFLMVSTGSWRVKLNSLNENQHLLYKIYSVIMHIYLFCFVISLYIAVIPLLRDNNIDEAVEAISVIILCTLILIKAYISQRKKITEMIRKIEHQERDMESWDDTTIKIYTKNAKYTQIISIFMFIASSLCGTTLVVCKFIVYIQRTNAAALVLLNGTIIEKPLPYLAWRPVDHHEHYLITFLIDSLSAVIGCTFNTVTQLIFVTLFTYITGQLIILQQRFKLYGYMCNNLNNFEKIELLKKLITDHKEIIFFVEQLDDNMKYLLLLEFTINSFEITSCFYQFFVFEKDAIVIFRLTYLLCMVMQIFVIAWHANELSLQSTEISSAVYDSEWYELPQYIKELLLIITVRAQKPLNISVGPFFNLGNSTAVTSMKAAYSYLALLTNRRR